MRPDRIIDRINRYVNKVKKTESEIRTEIVDVVEVEEERSQENKPSAGGGSRVHGLSLSEK